MVRLEAQKVREQIQAKRYFNSYMVRLEAKFSVGRNCRLNISIPIWCDWKTPSSGRFLSDINFNSYMVRLEEIGALEGKVLQLNFNSYMVRLEAVSVFQHFRTTGFQFLYGAIGRKKQKMERIGKIIFQFLYGAIGRNGHQYAEKRDRYFNSYMVRLEVGYIFSIAVWHSHFNSYMVRLEDITEEGIWGLVTEFQFLYGAIGRTASYFAHTSITDFNSYMVRLEGRKILKVRNAGKFQFLYGAIGRDDLIDEKIMRK